MFASYVPTLSVWPTIAMSVVGSSFRIWASSRKEAFDVLLNADELKPNRMPDSKVTFTAASPLVSVTFSTCAPSILAASAAFLSILWPMATPAPVPTAAPTAAPIAAPLPLPISPPMIAPAAAPDPPPITPPFAVLFIVLQLPNNIAPLNNSTLIFIFFIICSFKNVTMFVMQS